MRVHACVRAISRKCSDMHTNNHLLNPNLAINKSINCLIHPKDAKIKRQTTLIPVKTPGKSRSNVFINYAKMP